MTGSLASKAYGGRSPRRALAPRSGGTAWVRVNRHCPCPICAEPDWCGICPDGTLACCMRVKSDRLARALTEAGHRPKVIRPLKGKDDRGIIFPRWERWNAQSAKKRLQNAERKRRQRDRERPRVTQTA